MTNYQDYGLAEGINMRVHGDLQSVVPHCGASLSHSRLYLTQ
jgi:hypothetical protein